MRDKVRNYLENQQVGMTADQYYDMCQVLGEAVVEENIPVEFEDLPLIVQISFDVYNSLQDNWDLMGGNYLGKIKSNLTEVMSLLGIEHEDFREVFTYITLIDRVRSELISQEKQQEKAHTK